MQTGDCFVKYIIALYSVTSEDAAYTLVRVPELEPFSRRLTVRWGASARSWSQWTVRHPKEIVELRRQVSEPMFPGFSNLLVKRSELLLMPESWRVVLASVRGVYLMVCLDKGEQYVGSAVGIGGFWARWAEYAANGHGGNKLLVSRGPRDYWMSVLEVMSMAHSSDDGLDRERHWKHRLGSKAHGLNLN